MIKNGRKNFAERESDHLSSHEESKNSYVVKSKDENTKDFCKILGLCGPKWQKLRKGTKGLHQKV